MAKPESSTHYELEIRGDIKAQVDFWHDPARVRGFVGGLGSGKTFAGVIEILRQPPNTTGAVIAPTYPLLRDATQRVFFEACPAGLIKSHNKQEQRTELADGKTIFWRSAERPDNLRGPNLNWAWGDEWAYCSEDTHKIVLGRLRRAPGRFWFTTTPNGQNWLYHWSVQRDLGYGLHHAHTRDNPFNLDGYAEGLAIEYANDPLFAAQELAGQWVDLSGSKRFPGLLVEAVFSGRPRLNPPELEPIIGTERIGGEQLTYVLPESVRFYQLPEPGKAYRIGLDCAEGVRGGDDSSIAIVEQLTGETVCVGSGEWEPTEEHAAYAAILSRFYNLAPTLPERNNHGHAVIGALDRFGIEVMEGLDGRPGWQTSAQSKARMCGQAFKDIKVAKSEEISIFPDAKLKEQVKSIDRLTLKGPGKGRFTKVDDEFIAWALANQARMEDDGIILYIG